MDNAAQSRAYKRGYNFIAGASFFCPRSAVEIINRCDAEPPELRDAFLRGIEAGERRRLRELMRQWEDGRRWLKTLAQTERVMARCWAMNAALGFHGLYDGTVENGGGQKVAARTDELKAVLKRLAENRLLKPEAIEGL